MSRRTARALISAGASGQNPRPMGRGDNRRTPKMNRKKNQRRLKDRMRRRAEQVRRERSGETAPQEQA